MNAAVPPEYRERFDRVVKNLDFEDPPLLAAIIQIESAWNSWATRYESNFKDLSRPAVWAKSNGITEETEWTLQRLSWGLGQIMGATARYCGFGGPLTQLCDPEVGISWSAVYLKRLLQRYRYQEDDVIAAYNAGSVKREDAGYVNQPYVDKVKKALAPMRSAAGG